MSDEVPRDEPVHHSGEGNETPHDAEERLPPAREEARKRLPAEIFYLASPRHERPRLTIQPSSFVALALLAFVAFALMGYFGYPSDIQMGYVDFSSNSVPFYILYHPAGALFVWFGVVIILILRTIFRGRVSLASDDTTAHDAATRNTTISDIAARRIRTWKWLVTAVTVMWMVLEAVIYVRPEIIGGLPSTGSGLESALSQGRLFWNALNATIIGIFLVDRVIQWSTGRREATGMTLQYPNVIQREPIKLLGISLPRLELIAQDLFAGATLCLVLGFVLQREVLNFLFQAIHRVNVASCAVSLVFGDCQEGSAHLPMTLHNIDWIIMFFASGVSGLILASMLSIRVMYVFRDKDISAAVAEGIYSLVYSFLILIKSYLQNIRAVAWPVLLLLGTFALGVSARLFEMYLHILSNQHTCHVGASCVDLREFAFYYSDHVDTGYWLAHSLPFELLILALTLGLSLFGIFCILFSARVLLIGQVAEPLWANWVRFVLVTVFFIACLLWVFSIVESAFMGMLLLAGITTRVPFPQLGVSTTVSFIICALAFIGFIVQKRRQGQNPWHVLRDAFRRS